MGGGGGGDTIGGGGGGGLGTQSAGPYIYIYTRNVEAKRIMYQYYGPSCFVRLWYRVLQVG